MLKPGEVENVEFSFYAHANNRLQTTAICEVEGGPTYKVQAVSEASTIKYTIDNTTINFGQQLFHKPIDKDTTLLNTGRVPFTYQVLGCTSIAAIFVGGSIVEARAAAEEDNSLLSRNSMRIVPSHQACVLHALLKIPNPALGIFNTTTHRFLCVVVFVLPSCDMIDGNS